MNLTTPGALAVAVTTAGSRLNTAFPPVITKVGVVAAFAELAAAIPPASANEPINRLEIILRIFVLLFCSGNP